MIFGFRQKISCTLACILILGCILLVSGVKSESSCSSQSTIDGPHLDFLIGPDIIGCGFTVWNYGTQPAYIIHWKIQTQGVNGTTVLGGDRQGIIVYLRPMRSRYMMPMTLPQTKIIQPVGRGEIEITVEISCKNAGYDITHTSYWMLSGGKVSPIMQH